MCSSSRLCSQHFVSFSPTAKHTVRPGFGGRLNCVPSAPSHCQVDLPIYDDVSLLGLVPSTRHYPPVRTAGGFLGLYHDSRTASLGLELEGTPLYVHPAFWSVTHCQIGYTGAYEGMTLISQTGV